MESEKSIYDFDIAVVGAGITGLVLAYEMYLAGARVVVLEANKHVGGVIQSERVDGFHLEYGPNTLLLNADLWRILVLLGLDQKLVQASPIQSKRFVLNSGTCEERLVPVPTSLATFCTTPLLSLKGKWEVTRGVFKGRVLPDDESVQDFFLNYLGNEATNRVVAPALNGIYAGNIQKLSARSTLPGLWDNLQTGQVFLSAVQNMVLDRATRRHPEAPRYPVSIAGGLATITESIASSLPEESVRLAHRVDLIDIERESECATVKVIKEGDSLHFRARHVAVTCEGNSTAQLLSSLAPSLSAVIKSVPYAPLGVIHMSADRSKVNHPLDGFGFLVPPTRSSGLLGVIFSSSIFPEMAPPNKILLTCFVGGDHFPEASDVSDPEVQKRVSQAVARILNMNNEPSIVSTKFWKQAVPNFPLGHYKVQDLVTEWEANNPNISLLGSWRRKVSLPDRVTEAAVKAREIITDWQDKSAT